MFRDELLAVRDRRFVWAFFLIPALFAGSAVWQVVAALSGSPALGAPPLEALMIETLATVALPVGWFGLVFGAFHAAGRLREPVFVPRRFTALAGAVVTRCLIYILAIIFGTWGALAIGFASVGQAIPEWSLMISTVLRLCVFAAATIVVGVAAAAAMPTPTLAVAAALGLQGLLTVGIRYLATNVTAWAVLASPVDNYLVWASGYRIVLIPSWQASVFWLLWFTLFIGGFWLIYRRRTR